jgi:hypothetical protein
VVSGEGEEGEEEGGLERQERERCGLSFYLVRGRGGIGRGIGSRRGGGRSRSRGGGRGRGGGCLNHKRKTRY